MPALIKSATLARLPQEWPEDLMPAIQANLHTSRSKIVVLDDDPTGTQTVHHVPVLTRWSVAELTNELQKPESVFYLLTNSRSLQPEESRALTFEIGQNLRAAAQAASKNLVAISRSDSTLRGHFPLEIEALAEGLSEEFDACLIIPFFLEGGRFTIDNIHYVAHDNYLTPAGETEFARDATFGYHSSNLRNWVQEKSFNKISASDVAEISIDDLRLYGPDRVVEKLCQFKNAQMCIVNAASYRDLEVLVLALLRAEEQGKRFLFRSAASFVRTRAGITPQDLLDRATLQQPGSAGGIIIVGSHVPRTTAQLSALQSKHGLVEMELPVRKLFNPELRANIITKSVALITTATQSGKDVLIFTSREVIQGIDGRQSLEISRLVSASLIEIVQHLEIRPRFLIAKGGITSSDIATQGLRVVRAEVLGQILPGIPVWRLGPESKFPGLPYVVFPGNVGNDQTLVEIFEKLSTKKPVRQMQHLAKNKHHPEDHLK